MKQFCNLLFICCIIYSCKRQIEDNPDIIKINVDINTSKEKPIETFFSAIEAVPLETTEKNLLQKPDKIIFKHNKYYIFDSGRQYGIFIFDEKGNFIRSSLHKQGQGPGEYRSLMDFDINPETGHIEIVDIVSYRIMRYDEEFNYINETLLPRAMIPVSSFKAITSDLYVFHSSRDMELRHPSAREEECLQFYSSSEKEVTGRIRLSSDYMWNGTQSHVFNMRGPDLFFTNRYPNNNIFQILYNEMSIKKVVEFDFGKRTFRIDNIPKQSVKSRDFMDNNIDRFVFPMTKHENDSCYFCFVMFKNYNLHLVSYNKQSGKTLVSPQRFVDGGVITPPVYVDNAYFYVIAWPDGIKIRIKQSLLDSQSQEVIANLREDDNPVILKYKIVY